MVPVRKRRVAADCIADDPPISDLILNLHRCPQAYRVFLRLLLANLHPAMGETHEDNRARFVSVRNLGGSLARSGAARGSSTVKGAASATRANAA
jgi:hypothetical protein